MATLSPSLQLRRLQQEAKAKELGQQLDSLKNRMEVHNKDELTTELDALLQQLESKDSRIGSLESELEKKSTKIQELMLQMEALGQELDGSYKDTLKSLQSGDLAVAADQKQLEQKLSNMEALLNQSKLVAAGSTPVGLSYQMAELLGQLSVSSNLTDFLQEHLSHAEEEKREVIKEKVRLESQINELKQVQKIRDDKIAMLEKKNLDQATQIIQLATQLADLQESMNQVAGVSGGSAEEGFVEHLRFLARSAEEERDALALQLKEKDKALDATIVSFEETKKHISRLESSVQEQSAAKDQLSKELEMLQSTLVTKESELQSLHSTVLSSKSQISSLTSEATSLQTQLKATEEQLVETTLQFSTAREELTDKQTALATLGSNLHALEEQIKQKESELTSSVEQASTLTKTLEQRNWQIKQMEDKVALVSKQAEHSSAALDEARSSKLAVEKTLSTLENTIADLKEQLAESRAQLSQSEREREEEREQLKSQIQLLIEQLSEKCDQLQASANAIEQLRKQQDDAHKLKENVEKELSEYKEQLGEVKARYDETSREAEVERLHLVDRIAALELRLVEIDQVAGLAKEALEKALDDKDASEEKIRGLEEKLAEARNVETPTPDQETSDKLQELTLQLESSQEEALVLNDSLLQARQALESAEQKSLELERQLSGLNEQFQQAQMENEAPALQEQVTNLENEIAELKSSLLTAEEKCISQEEALQKAVGENELHDQTVTVFQEHVSSLQKQLEDLESEPDETPDVTPPLEARISELTDLLAAMETQLASSHAEYDTIHERLEQAQLTEQSLVDQLSESKAELEKYLTEHAEEAQLYSERGKKCMALQAELEVFQLRVSTLETALAEIKSKPSTSQGQINEIAEEREKMEADFKRQIHELDSRLSESTKEAQLLRVNLSQSLELRSTHAARLEELTGQLEVFHAKLREKEQVIAAKDKSIKEQAARLEELISHIAEVESQLTESDKITKFSRTCSNRLEEEKRINEARSQKRIFEMETQLAETGRQLETLQSTLSSVEDEKRELKEKRKDLEAKLNNLTMLLRLKEEEIEVRDRNNRDHVMKVDDVMRQLAEVEGRLQVSNQVAEFLQSCLSKADEENRLNESKWQKKIGELEIAIAETKRTSEMAVLRAEEEKRLSESKAKDLVMSVERSINKFLASHCLSDREVLPALDNAAPVIDPPKQKRQDIFLAGVFPLAILAVWAGVSLPCVRPPVTSVFSAPVPTKTVPVNAVTMKPESNAWQNKTPAPGISSSPDCLETVTTFFRTVAVKEPVVIEEPLAPKSSSWSVSATKPVGKVDSKHIGQIHRAVTDLLSDSLMTNQYN